MNPNAATDRDQIVAHIHGLFQAFLRGDRDAIRRGHTEDWRGFQIRSRTLVRGIDEYMENADAVLASIRALRYELLDVDVQVLGDTAVVFYLAREWLAGDDGTEKTILLRSVDIYRREAGGWNQCGSNICVMPDEPSAVGTPPTGVTTPPPQRPIAQGEASDRALSPVERDELLATRETVWRACFAGDEARLRVLLPDDLVAIDPGDQPCANRDETIDRARRFAAKGGKLLRLEFPHTQFQVFSPVVIIYTNFVFEVEVNGVRTTTAGRATEVFERRNGRWINTGWHLDSGR